MATGGEGALGGTSAKFTWSVPVDRPPPPNTLGGVVRRTQKKTVKGEVALCSVLAQPLGRSRSSCLAVAVAWSDCCTVVGWISGGLGAVVGSEVALHEAVSLVMKIRTVSLAVGVTFRFHLKTIERLSMQSCNPRLTGLTPVASVVTVTVCARAAGAISAASAATPATCSPALPRRRCRMDILSRRMPDSRTNWQRQCFRPSAASWSRSSSSAICTALVAAPLRRLSETTNSARPRSCARSLRMRPTSVSSLPAPSNGIG